MNDTFSVFSEELNAIDMWDDVTTIEVSDFGRTLSPNSGKDTDHGWGGNHVMLGGGDRMPNTRKIS